MMNHDHDRVVAGLISEKDLCKIREAICVQVEKIYDSCREKDCIEDARVRFDNLSPCEKDVINEAFNVKIRKAIVQDVRTDVEPVPFKRGFYTVDVKFIIKVILDFFTNGEEGNIDIHTIPGFITFDKKVILFGSEGNVKIFKSIFEKDEIDKPVKTKLQQSNLPFSKVEVAEPIPLGAKIRGILDKLFEENRGEEVVEENRGECTILSKRVFVTVGLFSIIKLARYVQLLIPAFDFCFPNKKCVSATEENPCDLFETIEFPFEEFFPPQKFDFPGALDEEKAMFEEMDDKNKKH